MIGVLNLQESLSGEGAADLDVRVGRSTANMPLTPRFDLQPLLMESQEGWTARGDAIAIAVKWYCVLCL